MLTQEAATRWALVLVLLGVHAWIHKQTPDRWGVWVEDAGVLLADWHELAGWLVLHLQRELSRDEMPCVVGQVNGEVLLG